MIKKLVLALSIALSCGVAFSQSSPPNINTQTKGTLSVSRGGTGASDAANARKNLGVVEYNGCVPNQDGNGLICTAVEASYVKLVGSTASRCLHTDENGYITISSQDCNTGAVAGSVEWTAILNKPSTFTPSAHTHVVAGITDFPTTWDWSKLTSVPSTFTPTAHVHAQSDITGLASSLSGKVGTSVTVNGHALTSNVTVTKADVGLGNADNTADIDKPISTAVQTALDGKASASHNQSISTITGLQTALDGKQPTGSYEPANSNIQAHISSVANPHSVTKSQVGLGSVDNTADVDKPVSTATQTALSAKANDAAVVHKSGDESITGVKIFEQIKLNGAAGLKCLHTDANGAVTLMSQDCGQGALDLSSPGSIGSTTPAPIKGTTVEATVSMSAPSACIAGDCRTSWPTMGGSSPSFINVKENGVKGDGVKLTDITTTAGSADVTSTSRTFVSGDVGKLFSILGAGASSSQPLNGHIVSVNGHTATLNKTAGTSISGTGVGTFATDDSLTIRAIIVANPGMALFIPPGIYGFGTTVFINKAVGIYGAGSGKTILKWMSEYDINDPSHGGNQAIFSLDGGTLSNPTPDIEIADMEFDGISATMTTYSSGGKAVIGTFLLRTKIHDVYAHDFPATCLGVDYLVSSDISHNVLQNCGRLNPGNGGGGFGIGIGTNGMPNESMVISSNTTINCRRGGIFVETQSGAQTDSQYTIANNIVIDLLYDSDGIIDSGTVGTVIVGNRVIGKTDGTVGAGISSDPGTNATAGGNGLITGNSVRGFAYGIKLKQQYTQGEIGSYTVRGNRVQSSNLACVYVTGAVSPATKDITISDNDIVSCGGPGVQFESSGSNYTDIELKNNKIRGSGKTTAVDAEKSGIYLNATIDRIAIQSNTISDDGSGKQLYGITVPSGRTITHATVKNNVLSSNATSATNYTGSITGDLEGATGTAAVTAFDWNGSRTSSLAFPSSAGTNYFQPAVNFLWATGVGNGTNLYLPLSGTLVQADVIWRANPNATNTETQTVTFSVIDTSNSNATVATFPAFIPSANNCTGSYCHVTVQPTDVVLTAGHLYALKLVTSGAWTGGQVPGIQDMQFIVKLSGAN